LFLIITCKEVKDEQTDSNITVDCIETVHKRQGAS